MIVDIHTHIFHPASDFGPKLMADMKRSGLDTSIWNEMDERHLEATLAADVAIVFGLQASATDWNISNEVVSAHVKRASQRLLFFASIDPLNPGYMEELEKCHQDLGAVVYETNMTSVAD